LTEAREARGETSKQLARREQSQLFLFFPFFPILAITTDYTCPVFSLCSNDGHVQTESDCFVSFLLLERRRNETSLPPFPPTFLLRPIDSDASESVTRSAGDKGKEGRVKEKEGETKKGQRRRKGGKEETVNRTSHLFPSPRFSGLPTGQLNALANSALFESGPRTRNSVGCGRNGDEEKGGKGSERERKGGKGRARRRRKGELV
jgi:hypothetical protein